MTMNIPSQFIFFNIVLIGLFFSINNVSAADPDPLQDFCVAELNTDVIVNGFVCKNAKEVSGKDFFFRGLGQPGNTNNAVGSLVTPANVMQLPGLNTLGISLVRIDFAQGGINPPHTHPRASEVLVVLEGELFVGFIDTNNTLFSQNLIKGDVFVFPRGLVHFQQNVGHGNSVVISGLNSQLPGTQVIANSLFGANPPIPDTVLARAFQINQTLVDYLQAKFSPTHPH
eukprot:Gb_05078 [translate_table: standard]